MIAVPSNVCALVNAPLPVICMRWLQFESSGEFLTSVQGLSNRVPLRAEVRIFGLVAFDMLTANRTRVGLLELQIVVRAPDVALLSSDFIDDVAGLVEGDIARFAIFVETATGPCPPLRAALLQPFQVRLGR